MKKNVKFMEDDLFDKKLFQEKSSKTKNSRFNLRQTFASQFTRTSARKKDSVEKGVVSFEAVDSFADHLKARFQREVEVNEELCACINRY